VAPSTDPVTGAVSVDTGGTQVLGLAVTDGAIWAVSYDTSTLAKIDPATNTVVATVDVPGGASAASLSSGLWVAAYGDPGHLYKIDTDTATIALTVDVGDLCCDLTEGGGLVWALDRRGAVIGVDPESGAVSRTLPVELDLNAHNNVVFAGGQLWVASDTTALFRLDPVTGRTKSIDVGGGVPFLAQDGRLWGASPTELWAVDPGTGEVAERVEVPDSTEVMALAIEGRTAWVGMRHPGPVGVVLELDLRDGTVRSELPVDIPARIELALGSRWISDSGSSLVLRVGP
jgi:streptogramin lyase